MTRSLRLWFGIFILMNLVNWHDGGPNAASRFAALQSMTERHTFEITPYRQWTLDWARTPDGKVYSNKAPGPMFIAFPVAWMMNQAKARLLGSKAWERYPDGETLLVEPTEGYRTVICWIFQTLPFLILVALSARWLIAAGASLAAVNYAVIALFFGSTLSFLIDVYFGHAVSACALLALLLFYSRKNHVAMGFCFGLSMLSDYGTIFLLPALLAMLWIGRSKSLAKTFWELAVGGAVPAVFFAWYHTVCFGKPWALPMQFQNPLFVETTALRPQARMIWGVANPFPDWIVLLKLCFGPGRGILFTQPWMWVSFAATLALAFAKKLDREALAFAVFCFGGFFGLLWMNAGFNGWQGGDSPGPRYMSIIFPAIAFFTGMIYDRVARWAQRLLWVGLGVSVLFRIAGYSGEPFAHAEQSVWPFVIGSLVHNRLWARGIVTLGLLTGYFIWAGISIYRRAERECRT